MEKKLVLKKEFIGLTVTVNSYGIGQLTVDVDKIDESEYIRYHKLGFNIFDEVIVDDQPIEDSSLESTPEANKDIVEVPVIKNSRKKK